MKLEGLILSLCDHSGVWSQPYLDAGYEVLRIDLQSGQDVRLLPHRKDRVHGILCAPPCDHLASSGARWWKSKGESALLESLAIVDACLRQVAIHHPAWWALENPRGRLKNYLGPAAWSFQPCDFGDPYKKSTQLWGHFTPPKPLWADCTAVEPVRACATGSFTQQMGGRKPGTPSHTRVKNERSRTPPGFARAFFASNP